ncbi:hypothetical protein FHS76_000147 [Ochrobactrum daejeonense]|uniref:Uncharacterized protein n=1 Tax=Brucella daejeonensis TaxID=659015 RepID=A0A7W9AU05_9HYPH|nr:hypothetical protein [Brucella daejeonensis]MBB5700309.1 hypothetical protein [Brucella daejeonensis]NKB78469.1 hypothetical protein [Brucella daejeonensis]
MQARTERRLGIAAALVLTAGAFVMPGVSTQVSRNEIAPESRIHLASASRLRAGLHHFIVPGEAMPTLVHYE